MLHGAGSLIMQLNDHADCMEVNVAICPDSWRISLFQEYRSDASSFLKVLTFHCVRFFYFFFLVLMVGFGFFNPSFSVSVVRLSA